MVYFRRTGSSSSPVCCCCRSPHRDIIFTNFLIAFFTAVSALSTCGIPVVNTGEYWSMFGQVVVLFSIQFGGLGVMTFASMVALWRFPQTPRSPQRMLTANELGTTKLSEVKGVLTVVLGTSIIAEVLTFVPAAPTCSAEPWQYRAYLVAGAVLTRCRPITTPVSRRMPLVCM